MKDEKGEENMNAEKPEQVKQGQEDGATSEVKIESLLQERFNQWSQPLICPFCGKTECKSFWHLLKLGTLPRSYLRPKHFFLLYGLVFVAIILILAVYIGFQMTTQK